MPLPFYFCLHAAEDLAGRFGVGQGRRERRSRGLTGIAVLQHHADGLFVLIGRGRQFGQIKLGKVPFVSAVQIEASGEDGLAVQEIIEAAIESWETNSVVTVNG